MANPYDDLADQLWSLLPVAAGDAAQRVRELDWPLTKPVSQTLIRRDRRNPAAWSSSTREVQHNILIHPDTPLHKLAPLLTPAVAAAASDCASMLVEIDGNNPPFWSPLEGRGWLLAGTHRMLSGPRPTM